MTCSAATLSLATVFYVARKSVGVVTARAAVRKCLGALAILPIDKQRLVAADGFVGPDFEDNILIVPAVTGGVDAIITRNVADFSHSPILVWEPAELLKRLSGGGSAPVTGAGTPAVPA